VARARDGRTDEGGLRPFILLLLLFFFLQTPLARASKSDSTERSEPDLFAIPLVFYTPETRWGFGAAGTMNFEIGRESEKASSLSLGGAYTLFDQILLQVPYELFLKGDRYWLEGELGYYDYYYEFYGIGNRTKPSRKETFTARYPRIRFTGLRRWNEELYAGIRYIYDDFRISERKGNGPLQQKEVPGAEGVRISGIGVRVHYDERDRVNYPTEGYLLQGHVLWSGEWTGSELNYRNEELDLRAYHDLGQGHILAGQIFMRSFHGTAPFNEMALLGGPKRMRGYYKGRFRDEHFGTAQLEYRKMLVWRIGVAAFGGFGKVAPERAGLFEGKYHPSYGGGLRLTIDQERMVNLRADIAFGDQEGAQYYLTYREAF
jgi:outer membrane protein assembly factor BamA